MQTDLAQGRGTITKERALRFRFSTMPRIVLEAKGLSLNAKTVYCKLVDYLYEAEDIFCWPSQEKLAEDLNTSKWTVIRCLNELRDYGLIDWKQQGLSKTNVYWLLEFPDSLIEEYERRQEEKRQARLADIPADGKTCELPPKDASTPSESRKKKARQEEKLRTHSGQGIGTVPIQELASCQFLNLQEYQTNNKQLNDNHGTTTTPEQKATSSDTPGTSSVDETRKDVVVQDETEPTAEEPKEDAEEAIRAMIGKLVELGVYEDFAEKVIREHGIARCSEVLKACNASSTDNPAGWIHEALVRRWNVNSKATQKTAQEMPSAALKHAKNAFVGLADDAREERKKLADASPHRELWEEIKGRLSEQIMPQSMASWIEPCYILAVADNRVILSAPTEFVGDWVVENYLDRLREILGRDVEIVTDEGSGETGKGIE